MTPRHELVHLIKEVRAQSIMQEDEKKPHAPELIDGGGKREHWQDAELSHKSSNHCCNR